MRIRTPAEVAAAVERKIGFNSGEDPVSSRETHRPALSGLAEDLGLEIEAVEVLRYIHARPSPFLRREFMANALDIPLVALSGTLRTLMTAGILSRSQPYVIAWDVEGALTRFERIHAARGGELADGSGQANP